MDDMDVTQPNMLPSPESNQENSIVPSKKPRGKRTARFTKPKPVRKVTGTTTDAGTKTASPVRKGKVAAKVPLKDQTNIQKPSDTEEVDDFDICHEDDKGVESKATSGDKSTGSKSQPKQRRGRRSAAERQMPIEEHHPTIENSVQSTNCSQEKGRVTRRTSPFEVPHHSKIHDAVAIERITEENDGFEYTPTQSRKSKKEIAKPAVKSRGRPRVASKEPVIIPETQFEPKGISSSAPDLSQPSDGEATFQQIQLTTHLRAGSKQRQPYRHQRAGSASSIEGNHTGSDITLRRRLGDVTRKLESLETKYQTLKEVGINEASENFSRLQASSAAERKAATDVIAGLKRDVGTQRSLAQEAKLLQQQLATKDKDLESAASRSALLSSSLGEAQEEIKALQAKLSVQRNASAYVESVDAVAATSHGPPGSAAKNKPVRTIMIGSAEAVHQAQVAQLKEDLYADLTGLILRGVEKGDHGDVYDCIQTGRNGRGRLFSSHYPYLVQTSILIRLLALHFHLSLSNSETTYDEAEFTYTPLLDADRDRDILALMPDYLQDEIAFSRGHATQFYQRVVDTLMKKERMMQSVEGVGGGMEEE